MKDAFDFALKIDLTFKGIVSAKAWEQCSKCEGYEQYNYQCPSWEKYSKCEEYWHFDYQCPLESRYVNIVPINDVDDSKVVENDRVPSEISSVVEEPLVNSDAPIIDESHVSSADISDVVQLSLVHPC